MKQKIIGVCGLIGSGKDTVADYLVSNHRCHRISFGDTLKDVTAELFGWDRTRLQGLTKEDRDWRELEDPFWTEALGKLWSPRIALQQLGTEIFRDGLHKDIWIICAKKRMRTLEHAMGYKLNFVFSDCRFPNEVAIIEQAGGEIWWVRRGDLPEWWMPARVNLMREGDMEAFSKHWGVHPSEFSWINSNFKHVIDNDGTLDDLYKKVEELL